jgi:hypothetical protein
MRDLMFIGKEVKNSWGTFATSDRFIKEQPKLMAGFARAVLKGLRVVRQDREESIAAVTKFTELERSLATRMYDDLIGTFTKSGYVDEETQKNDLATSSSSPKSMTSFRRKELTTSASCARQNSS